MIIPNVYGVFDDATLFESPDMFDPDRYMANPLGIGKGVTTEQPLKDFVYGFGKRACPGMILAKNSIVSILVNNEVRGTDVPLDRPLIWRIFFGALTYSGRPERMDGLSNQIWILLNQ